MPRPAEHRRRRAFTLVELMVVVAVIGILLAITAVGTTHFITTGREAATRTTIKKVDEALNRKMAAFERASGGRELDGGTAVEAELARYPVSDALGRKRVAQKFFGMTFGETSKSGAGTDLKWTEAALGQKERERLAKEGVLKSTTPQAQNQNAEMLYWIVVNGPTFGADPVDADAFLASEVADTDGDGLMEFVDAWGNPLRFYRWPTRLLRPAPEDGAASAQATGNYAYHPLGPATGTSLRSDAPASYLITALPTFGTAVDPAYDAADTDPPETKILKRVSGSGTVTPLIEDREDALGDALERFHAEMTSGATLITAARTFETYYHTPNTWHSPLIVSAGADGAFGLHDPSDRANFGHLAQPEIEGTAYSTALQDNLSNLNSRAAGTGGQ